MTYQETAFNLLTDAQKVFVKAMVYKQIKHWGRVCPHDLPSHIRADMHINAPSKSWKAVCDNANAACWQLEATGEIIRTQNNRGQVILCLP
jgi:hypothetical protein